jgi:ATP-dependent helicase/nuclease subunit B
MSGGPTSGEEPDAVPRRAPRPGAVATIPIDRPFLPTLAHALLKGDLPHHGARPREGLALTDVTLLLPTRRATRAAQEAFLAVSGQRALLLPRIAAIGEPDEDLSLLADLAGASGLAGATALELPPAIDPLARRLALMRLVLAWGAAETRSKSEGGTPGPIVGATSPAAALRLADALARLLDMAETEEKPLDGLETLVPEGLAEHWQTTLDFLGIVTRHWPAHLAEKGLLSAAVRRNRAVRAEARRLAARAADEPVIVAGVTGSVPATADLMAVVAGLEHGAIVLPGLDLELDEGTWRSLAPPDGPGHPEHPQYGLARLLAAIGVGRAEVRVLDGAAAAAVRRPGRARLAGEIMRPAAATEQWHRLAEPTEKAGLARALEGITLLEAATAADEAEAVALLLREAVETPGRTAALVSPDRLLARRVAERLTHWGILIDDSAGRPFAKTEVGSFLELLVDAVATGLQPVAVMSLLRHPLTRLGLSPGDVRRAGRSLELAAFRRPWLGRGITGLQAGYARAAHDAGEDAPSRGNAAARRLGPRDRALAGDVLGRLVAALGPLEAALTTEPSRTLAELVAAHVAAAEALAAGEPTSESGPAEGGGSAQGSGPAAAAAPSPSAPSPLWQGEAGEAAASLFARLLDPALESPSLPPEAYPELYRALVATESVRERRPVHPRLAILGPLEARLQQPDVVILGGLTEGTWPAMAEPSPWLNRPMRAALGLPSPEAEIGRAAHDFSTLLGAPRVYLTRPAKREGDPTVPSRWLARLEGLLGGLGLSHEVRAGGQALRWAEARNRAGAPRRLTPPAPRPPVALRPRRLSVTAVERWLASPYAIFARHILDLEALPALGRPLGPIERGELLHEVVGQFAAKWPTDLPADPVGELRNVLHDTIREWTGDPRVAALWLPRFERFVTWFGESEAERRHGVERVVTETAGKWVLAAPGGPFTLTARADRIDLAENGLVITDYKTGAPPRKTAVMRGSAPQLPLEAAMASAGVFDGVPAEAVARLRYIRATGGEPPGETIEIGDAKAPVATIAAAAIRGLERLVAAYDDESTPYTAVPRAGFADRSRYDEFRHLARVGEWGSGRDDDEDDESRLAAAEAGKPGDDSSNGEASG